MFEAKLNQKKKKPTKISQGFQIKEVEPKQ